MSLKRRGMPPIPERTAEIAHAAFPKGNVYIQMRDEFGSIYTDDMFADLYPQDGQPAIPPWQLALVTVMQFAENLSDRQAANAVRDRIAWKYVLSLELTDAGFDYSVLSEFRSRLITNGACGLLFDELLRLFVEKRWLKARGRQRTDSTAILAAVRELNQLEIVGETLRHALNILATVVPEWLKKQVAPEWFDRYGERFEEYRLPSSKRERQELSEAIGQDGYHLMNTISEANDKAWLWKIPAIETLRQMWIQQYWLDNGRVKRRDPKNMPPNGRWIRSPYDTEARYGKKRGRDWVGYKVHFTETCDDDLPHIITQVETVAAIEQDHAVLTTLQDDLANKQVLPKQQFVDAGYVSAKRIIYSREHHNIDLVGPVHNDPSWQARDAEGYDVSCFEVDWKKEKVICPQRAKSTSWNLAKDAIGETIVQIIFDKMTCEPCAARSHCTKAKKNGRSLTLRYPQERHELLQTARVYQKTEEFKKHYQRRAGVEGTFSQTNRNSGLKQARYIGMDKTHLQNLATAAATNILRVVTWLNEIPFAETRLSRFAALNAA